MPFSRSRGGRGRSISPSQMRKKTWSPFEQSQGGPLVGTLAAPTVVGSTLDTFIFTPRPDVEESTIIRSHLQATFDPKAVSAAAQTAFTFALGVGIVTAEAAATAGGVPDPGFLAVWDGWYLHKTWSWHGLTATGFIENRHIDIDSKGMRKLQSGNVIIVAVSLSASGGGGSGTLSYALGGRQLILLP